jgi:crotonobetainyl-CoA:carnitine CoA-transferase CaiB-like acyl-CoA transferase
VNRAPLRGLRVLDLGTRIAAPFCAGLLGEQGAEVIKIEKPGTGDPLRQLGPFAESDDGPYSLYWSVEGRGRKSVTLDLRHDRGRDVFLALAEHADVICENFRPGTLERWGIDPPQLPSRVVTVRISTFGQEGPKSLQPGLDRSGVAYGGLLNLTGEPDRPPVRPGVTVSDYLTGVFAAQAALGLLYERDATGTGEGGVVDAYLFGSVVRILEWTIAAYDHLGEIRGRTGNRLEHSAPLDNYLSRDGRYVCVVAAAQANFTRLTQAMGRPDLLDDARFSDEAARARHGELINSIVADWVASHAADDVERLCIEHDVPVGLAYDAADIVADPQAQARGDVLSVDDPVVGAVLQQAPFPRPGGEASSVPTGAPLLGQHTDEVLRELLGFDVAELAELRSSRTI